MSEQGNKKSEIPSNCSSDDKELDDLLDSALEDFSKHKEEDTKPISGDIQQHEDPPTEQLWNEEFITSQAKMFEEKMAALFGGGETVDADQITLGFQRIAEAAAMAVRAAPTTVPADSIDPSVSQSITDALKGLSEGRENLQTPFSPEDIAGMFGNIDLNESGENNAFLPFMQNMMQSLLSSEVLLPSLKDLTGKYPEWLRENGDKVPKEDKERYEKQLKLMEDVCRELEKEKPDDLAEVKRVRFQTVLDMMQSMQDLGQPPADLVGDLGPGNLNLPTIDPSAFSDPNQCATS
ncbi:peroxisomal biogenesis factor 19 [Wyeomyia smithii]|uniref:peroxisomal biogenesis factor 19 n=1 Tax=Wyeomyia smithii TaxID=174621 RepID=UPI002468192F|nr:peroxisomal biogenesis factor 19 [Wyeomyia smithii]XP_055542175.1 peroxisomal biogenesis factor 19 [Wyeomyia smithii]